MEVAIGADDRPMTPADARRQYCRIYGTEAGTRFAMEGMGNMFFETDELDVDMDVDMTVHDLAEAIRTSQDGMTDEEREAFDTTFEEDIQAYKQQDAQWIYAHKVVSPRLRWQAHNQRMDTEHPNIVRGEE